MTPPHPPRHEDLRPRSLAAPVLLAACGVALLGGCGGEVELTPAEQARAEELAGPVVAELAGSLMARLTVALDSGDVVGAVEYCSTEAQALTASVNRSLGDGVAVGRTSERYRNPANRPDRLDSLALARLALAAEGGGTPQGVAIAEGAGRVRYYRPVEVAPLCLQCHGPAEQLDPRVRALLAERYPEDRAIGYRVGDLRGAVRVSMPRALLGG